MKAIVVAGLKAGVEWLKAEGMDKIHGSVRFSIRPFNTEDHIQAAIGAVKEIASIKKIFIFDT
ncbi:MAG: hypothetical protein RQ743_11470 [Bacteroidales bacterium]|nr:hypothetical protein [Bacteroidales bacterium]